MAALNSFVLSEYREFLLYIDLVIEATWQSTV